MSKSSKESLRECGRKSPQVVAGGRGSGRRCTPWSECDSDCLDNKRNTDCAERVVMVVTK